MRDPLHHAAINAVPATGAITALLRSERSRPHPRRVPVSRTGVVYKARDPRTGETNTSNGDAFDKMFRREVRYLEACRSHPLISTLRTTSPQVRSS
jgi:hypothetical protein